MKRILLSAALLGLAACASAPGPSTPGVGFSEDMVSANRWRVSYTAPASETPATIEDKTLGRAAQLTLDKGNQWFEVKDKASGEHKRMLEIVMGKGETLAGGKIYDAKETLADLKAKASKAKAKTS